MLLLQKWRRWSARQSFDRKPDGRRAQHSLGGNLVAVPRKTEIAEQILSAAREVQKKANKIAFFFFLKNKVQQRAAISRSDKY